MFARLKRAAVLDALESGEEPIAPWRHEHSRTRPGSWFASEGVSFDEVLLERFGDRLGRVHDAP